MGYIAASDVPADVPTGVPLIGYITFVPTSITSTTAAAGFPISNVANPATHLKWRGGVNTGDEFVEFARLETALNYIAIAGHNFGSTATLVAVEGQDPAYSLLHFDGADASTTITESQSLGVAKTWTAAGNAQLDTAQSKFGGSSLLLDGTGDWVSTPSNTDMALFNSGFTFDCWIRVASLAAIRAVFGQATDANNVMRLLVQTTGALTFQVLINSVSVTLNSSAGVIVANQWQHVAIVRSSATLYLFVDGILIATGDEPRTIPQYTGAFFVGQDGLGASAFNGWIDEFRYTRFLARWLINFSPPTKPSGYTTLVNVSTDDSQILLHFDGSQGSTSISDSNSIGTDHTWTAAGNAQLDQSLIKFGTASLLCDGSGDFVSTPASSDFDFGTQDFTIDAWVYLNATGVNHGICGHSDGTSNNYFRFDIHNGNGILFELKINNIFVIQLSGPGGSFTTGVWYHVAAVRSGNVLTIYKNGVSEATAAFTANIPNFTDVFCVGQDSQLQYFNGRMDEFRCSIGIARWTTTFTPPTAAASAGSFITNDRPILFRWNPIPTIRIRLHLRPDAAPPEMAVFYCGYLTVLERSITIGRGHVPITYGRKTSVVNGMSESGNFLGRIVLGEYRESKAEFEWFKPDFFRITLNAFLDAAQETPFFWVWSPTEYPDEVGYVWLTNDPQPETDPATRRIALTLEMRGIA